MAIAYMNYTKIEVISQILTNGISYLISRESGGNKLPDNAMNGIKYD
jgi:hypothetical protein